jgi:hypothetical protein
LRLSPLARGQKRENLKWRWVQRFTMASFIVLFVLLVGTAASASDNRLDLGRREYEMAQAQSRLPKYGDCWKRAVGELEEGCKQLDDEEQGYLALKFANCFLAKSGQLTYPCDRSEKLNDCLEGVSNNAFTAYSNFYTVATLLFVL